MKQIQTDVFYQVFRKFYREVQYPPFHKRKNYQLWLKLVVELYTSNQSESESELIRKAKVRKLKLTLYIQSGRYISRVFMIFSPALQHTKKKIINVLIQPILFFSYEYGSLIRFFNISNGQVTHTDERVAITERPATIETFSLT